MLAFMAFANLNQSFYMTTFQDQMLDLLPHTQVWWDYFQSSISLFLHSPPRPSIITFAVIPACTSRPCLLSRLSISPFPLSPC